MMKGDGKFDVYIRQQLEPRLEPGEAIVCTGFLIERSLAWASVGMLGMIGKGYFFAALTDRRLLLIATELAFSGLKQMNSGVVDLRLDELASLRVEGSAFGRIVTIVPRNGATRTLRYSGVLEVTPSQERLVDTLASLGSHDMARMTHPTFVQPQAERIVERIAPAGRSTTHDSDDAAETSRSNTVEQLKQLVALHQSGVLTDEEYSTTRADLVKRL